MESSLSDPRLASVWRTMALHSKYLESFDTVHQFLLSGDGPLPIVDRQYIAIMVKNAPNIFNVLNLKPARCCKAFFKIAQAEVTGL